MMLSWLSENKATIIISFVLLAIVSAIIISMVNKKKKGKNSCGCDCANCHMSCGCHGK